MYCTNMNATITLDEDFKQRIRDEYLMKRFAKIVSQPEVKTSMLNLIVSNALEKTNLIRNVLQTDPYHKELHPVENAFEWDLDSLERRLQAAVKKVDILEDEHPETLLIFKLLTDLSNIEMLLENVRDDTPEAITYLKGCEEVVKIREKLGKKYAFNRLLSRVFEVQLNNCKEKERLELISANFRVNELLDHKMHDHLLVDPIYWRHYVNSYRAQYNDLELKLRLQEKRLVQEEESVREASQCNNIVFNETIAFYDSYNKKLRLQIEQYTEKYDTELEKVNNEVTNSSLTLSALHKKFKDSKDRVKFFREECEKMKAKIQGEEELARAQEQADEQALLDAKKKKKGSKIRKKSINTKGKGSKEGKT